MTSKDSSKWTSSEAEALYRRAIFSFEEMNEVRQANGDLPYADRSLHAVKLPRGGYSNTYERTKAG